MKEQVVEKVYEFDPVYEQEAMYRLPYHWFPEKPLQAFQRQEKQKIVFGLIDSYCEKPISKYLDVGCGDGRWTSDIYIHLRKSVQAIGIDFSDRAIAFAKLITPEIDFRVHRGEALPFPAGHFDLVTAIEVIEHVKDEGEENFLRECYRVLKKNGLFILTTPSWNLKLTNHHFRHYSIERLTHLMKSNGFDILDIRGQSLPYYGFKRKIRKVMGKMPKVWRLWKYSFQETTPEKALNLLVAARPK